MTKVIIIGASSGIARALATLFAEKGYELGLVAQRIKLLAALQTELKTRQNGDFMHGLRNLHPTGFIILF